MPIEIRELVIRAIVGPAPAGTGPDDSGPDAVDGGARVAALSDEDFERVVQACVRQVVAQLARERER